MQRGRRGSKIAGAFRDLCRCCSCRVVQCLCCSLKFGVLFLSFVLFVNSCLAFAGEALLVFDLGAAVVAQLEGKFLPPGTKIGDTNDKQVHGALIISGLYALLSSLVGFWSVCRRSLRAATIFFLLQVLNSLVALSLLLITWFQGIISFSTLLANVPGVILMLYLAVVCNSYRQALKAAMTRRAGPSGSSPFPASRLGFRDDDFDDNDTALDDAQVEHAGAAVPAYRDNALSLGGGGEDGDELVVTAKDVELGGSVTAAASAGAKASGRPAGLSAGQAGQAGAGRRAPPLPVSSRIGGGVAALAEDGFDDEDDDGEFDDDGDLGKPTAARAGGGRKL